MDEFSRLMPTVESCWNKIKSYIVEAAEHTEVRNRINARIKAIKRLLGKIYRRYGSRPTYGAQKKVSKMLKNRKKPINEFVQSKVTKDVWEKYFRKLYNTEGAISTENYETNHEKTLSEEEVMANQERTEDAPRQLQAHNVAEHKHETLYRHFEGKT